MWPAESVDLLNVYTNDTRTIYLGRLEQSEVMYVWLLVCCFGTRKM